MLDLSHCMNGAELVRGNAYDSACRTIVPQDARHAVGGFVQMVLVANKQEIRFAGKHINHMGDDGFPFYFNQRFRHQVTSLSKALAKA